MKFDFIVKNRGTWPVKFLCGALGVSRGGFYEWVKRPPSTRQKTDEAILAEIRTSFALSDKNYGARRVHPDVLAAGHKCGLHKIERLMRINGIKARPKRRAKPSARPDGLPATVAPNVLDRQFEAPAPNMKWVADFTYIWTAQGWLFVAAVLDLYSRRIVGWSMHAHMTSELVMDALMMAVFRRGNPKEVLHHSDQGTQYTSEQFQRLLRDLGVTCSMSRSGNVWDNSVMESFFASLKVERVNRRHYITRDEARADVFDYIERFYNPRRRHSTLGYVSPIEFEQEYERKQIAA